MCKKTVDRCARPECSRQFELKDRREVCDDRGKPGHNLTVVEVDQAGKDLCRWCVLEDDLIQACTKLEEDVLEKGGLRALTPVSGYEWSDSGSSSSSLSSPPDSDESGDEVEGAGDEGIKRVERVGGAEGGAGGAGNRDSGDNSNAANVASSSHSVFVRDIYTSDSDGEWWEGDESSEYSESEDSVDNEEEEETGGGMESACLGKRKRGASVGSVASSGASNGKGNRLKSKRLRDE